eukprot:gnl/TRDRNA2_/TRDRNA2_133532_c0_seq1.p1 gnl/TRDRNA2_/TRDRNA2_133532_c0~~gnl/TRDRNA2_/TRDRNA2_133532_c0_seq1.p1  ORF type:complete len:311 (+),score=60.23 gnl/TRDRNA2_/TRDRNA2_133532_c0_seq1:55-987(+)
MAKLDWVVGSPQDLSNKAVVLLPPERRKEFLELLDGDGVDKICLTDDEGDVLGSPTDAEKGYLFNFLTDAYFNAPLKSYSPARCARVGYDNIGTYLHANHLKRYYAVMSPDDSTVQKANTGAAAGELSQMSRRVIMCVFQAADKNEDGILNKAELGMLLRRAVPHLSSADVQEIFDQIDTNKSSDVNYEEFVAWLTANESGSVAAAFRKCIKNDKDSVLASFRMWDRDGDGGITQQDLEYVLRKLDPKITRAQVAMTFDAMDADHSKVVDYAEFLDFVMGGTEQGGPPKVIDPCSRRDFSVQKQSNRYCT